MVWGSIPRTSILLEEVPLTKRNEVTIEEWHEMKTDKYSDGSQVDGAAAALTTEEAAYLAEHATVMDPEMLEVYLAI